MNMRKFTLIVITILIATAAFASVVLALDVAPQTPVVQANLANVRDFAPAPTADSLNYAVDGDQLFVGKPGAWMPVTTPAASSSTPWPRTSVWPMWSTWVRPTS